MNLFHSLCTPYYDNQYNWLCVSGSQSTANAIKNPFTFYYAQDNDWSSTHNYDYWNKNFTTSVGIVSTATLKTIYDPANSGFTQPMTAAFTNFTLNGSNTSTGSQFNVNGVWNFGWYFYTSGWKTGSTVFFQALGIRDVYSRRPTGIGTLILSGSNGYAWSVGASSASSAYLLYISSGCVYTQYSDFRSYGLGCHPVSE